jgi:hypothetical protein
MVSPIRIEPADVEYRREPSLIEHADEVLVIARL